MNMNIGGTLLLFTALMTAQAPALAPFGGSSSVDPEEREALRALERSDLATLRAGGAPIPIPLDDPVRDELRRLERDELLELRAGDLQLSNHQLTTILLVLGIVAVLAILL